MVLEKVYEQQTTENGDSTIDALTELAAQTFTIGTVGDNENFLVLKAAVYMRKSASPTGNARFQIRSTSGGEPTQEVLAEGSYDVTGLGTSDDWNEVAFTSVAELSTSTQYALVVTGSDGTNDSTNRLIVRRASGGSAYTGGSHFDSDDNGITWTDDGDDLVFIITGNTWSGTLCEYVDVVGKAGANVASALSIGAKFELLNNYVLQAESYINAVTRYDWVDNYSSLTTNVKYILNQAVSDLAAIYAISYDMSGYTDRVEAETMINVLRDSFLRQQGLLRNQEVKRFMVEDT